MVGYTEKAFALDFYTAARCNSKKKRFSTASSRGDPHKNLTQDLVLFRKNGAQIEQYPPLFESTNHRRIRAAQTGGKLVGAEAMTGESDQGGGQNCRGGRPAAESLPFLTTHHATPNRMLK